MSPSPTRISHSVFTPGPHNTKKQVHFNLTEDLADITPLPADLACFLGDPNDEQTDGSCPPIPLVTSSMLWPHNGDGQYHDTHIGGAQLKTYTIPLETT